MFALALTPKGRPSARSGAVLHTVTILSNAKSCSWLPFNSNSTRQSLFQGFEIQSSLECGGTALTPERQRPGEKCWWGQNGSFLLLYSLFGKEMQEDTNSFKNSLTPSTKNPRKLSDRNSYYSYRNFPQAARSTRKLPATGFQTSWKEQL